HYLPFLFICDSIEWLEYGGKYCWEETGEESLNASRTAYKEEMERPSKNEFLDGTELELREKDAYRIVRKNMLWSMGLGAIPIPLVDFISVAAFQAKALKELSDLYDIPFFHHTVKNLVATLISGYGTVYFGQALAVSASKAIPVLGPLASLTSLPIMAGALTYATGKIFIQHFESGGTFLTFDPKKVRNYFHEYFQEGLKEAAKFGKQPSAESQAPHAAAKEAPATAKEPPAEKKETPAEVHEPFAANNEEPTESKETTMKKAAASESKETSGGGKKETVVASKDASKKAPGRS
ncbi:MAG: DUF697 domain-containing protein, partial [Candidatus Omnitrophota bacterium]